MKPCIMQGLGVHGKCDKGMEGIQWRHDVMKIFIFLVKTKKTKYNTLQC